ncbi:MAG: hypothetical protein ACHQF2_00450 [Flavobacteriales bacterium]
MNKKMIMVLAMAPIFLASCGGGADGKAIAEEICDCYKKANKASTTDIDKIRAEQDKCMDLQKSKTEELKTNAEEAKKYNDRINECSKQMLEDAVNS